MNLQKDFILSNTEPEMVNAIIRKIRETNPDMIYENIVETDEFIPHLIWCADERKVDAMYISDEHLKYHVGELVNEYKFMGNLGFKIKVTFE